jgi:hypothetical protein
MHRLIPDTGSKNGIAVNGPEGFLASARNDAVFLVWVILIAIGKVIGDQAFG